jgi:hypothetical protein
VAGWSGLGEEEREEKEEREPRRGSRPTSTAPGDVARQRCRAIAYGAAGLGPRRLRASRLASVAQLPRRCM